MNHRRKKVARARSGPRRPGRTFSVYSRTIHGAVTIVTTMIADNTTVVIDSTARASCQASSRPRAVSHSTNTGTNTDVRIPPSTSSNTMFGVLLATLYASARTVTTPRAYARADT